MARRPGHSAPISHHARGCMRACVGVWPETCLVPGGGRDRASWGCDLEPVMDGGHIDKVYHTSTPGTLKVRLSQEKLVATLTAALSHHQAGQWAKCSLTIRPHDVQCQHAHGTGRDPEVQTDVGTDDQPGVSMLWREWPRPEPGSLAPCSPVPAARQRECVHGVLPVRLGPRLCPGGRNEPCGSQK